MNGFENESFYKNVGVLIEILVEEIKSVFAYRKKSLSIHV